jgi:class 3 adenylate cyclase
VTGSTPVTEYLTARDGASLAYQVVGDHGPPIVFLRAWLTNLDVEWEEPVLAHAMRRIAEFGRLILIDRRGMGLSERVSDEPTLEDRADDFLDVLDAVGAQRAHFIGLSAAGLLIATFAAAHPDRTASVILFHPGANGPRLENDEAAAELFDIEEWVRQWGTQEHAAELVTALAPSRQDDQALIAWLARMERQSMSPTAARRTMLALEHIRPDDVYPAVHVPTLVLARAEATDDLIGARQVSALLPNATLSVVSGADHMFLSGPVDETVDEIERFITGAVVTTPDLDRVLLTVLFTDLVSSTEELSRRGDRSWAQLIGAHHQQVRSLLDRYRGIEQDTAGDGFFATFDGPARAVRCAMEIQQALARLSLHVRCGLHTGECELADGKASGVAVVTAARVMATAGAGEVRVTSTVRDLVAGSQLRFADLGVLGLKGLPEPRRLYRVLDSPRDATR